MGETELAKRAFLAADHVSALEHDLYDTVVRLEKQLAEVVRTIRAIDAAGIDWDTVNELVKPYRKKEGVHG